MSKRLYIGKLAMDARPEDLKSFFEGFGNMSDCRILTGFGFVEFESEKDAEEVVRNFNGKTFMGSELIVEHAKESRPRRQYDDRGPGAGYRGDSYGRGGGGGRGPKTPGIRLVVTGVSRDTSWQDLKDFARQAGNVTFADIDRDMPNTGVIEYPTRDEADGAIRDLDGKEIRGVSVRVSLDDRRSGGYSGGGGGGYGGRERYGGGGHGGGYNSNRHRSRSPPRRGGGAGYYEDRRGDHYEERRRGYDDTRERDDRRRDDRDRRDRY